MLWFAMLMSPAVTRAEVPENALPHLAIVRKGVLLIGRLAEGLPKACRRLAVGTSALPTSFQNFDAENSSQ